MQFYWDNILNIVCYLPLVGMILIMFMRRESESAIKWIANITASIGFIVSIPLLTAFNDPRFIDPDNGFRFCFEVPWIPQIGAMYKFGIDGISMLLVLLTTLLVITLINAPFIFSTIFHDPQMILGAYGMFAVTSVDDLDLMLWMKDNIPHNATILVNKQECGLFIPSVSHHKVIFPFIFSHQSHSYKLLSTLLEEGILNATTFNLMKHFNITHVYIGSFTTAHELYKHKWSFQPFLDSPNFELIRRVGDACLFAFSHKYLDAALQEELEYNDSV